MNRLSGVIADVACSGHVSLVDVAVGEDKLTAVVVETPATAPHLQPGRPIWLLFKETEVSLARNLAGDISLSNRLPATVHAIRPGHLLSEVELDYAGRRVISVITSRSVARLRLAPGDRVEAFVKANEMTLMVPDDES
ncbi:TOBE domain-containing protein [Methylomagnum sp.]